MYALDYCLPHENEPEAITWWKQAADLGKVEAAEHPSDIGEC
jgi:hypothetical protein